ncbi:MAG: hypothetical protein JHC94_00390, partial [Acidimicrobiia bacterium]|nr:hypothetical protein [Acidimicrobiia bacterium]
TIPAVVRYASDINEEHSVLNELCQLAASIATNVGTAVEPQRLAEQLVSLASQGTSQIETVELLLEMLQAKPAT